MAERRTYDAVRDRLLRLRSMAFWCGTCTNASAKRHALKISSSFAGLSRFSDSLIAGCIIFGAIGVLAIGWSYLWDYLTSILWITP